MNKFTDEKWLEIFRQCKSSGMADHQWCKDNNIPASTFYYHLRKLRKDSPGPMMEAKTMNPEYHEVIPLTVQDDISVPEPVVSKTMPCIQISFGNITIDIYNTAKSNIIAETLLAVKNVC